MNVFIVTSLIILFDMTMTIVNPAMPTIRNYFDTTVFMMKCSAAFNFLGYTLSVILYGHYADVFGRRKPLIFGIIFYLFGTIICIFSQYDTIFILGRFLQGLGESSGTLVGLTIIKDLYHGNAYTKKLSRMSVFMLIGPAIAPMLGGLIVAYYSWQNIFILLFILGVILLLITFKYLKETKQDPLEKNKSVFSSLKDCIRILKIRSIIPPYIMIFGIYATIFSNVSNMSFLFIDVMKATPIEFAFYTMIYVGAAMIGSFINSFLIERYNRYKLIFLGISMILISSITMMICHYIFALTPLIIEFIWIVESIGAVIMINNANGWILNSLPSRDTAKGVTNIAFLKLFAATIITYITSFIQNGTILPFSYVASFFAILSLMFIIYKFIKK
ncbi:MAG: MFS transporter [Anaplasmataceae bacterium]|nr:MFS transporter [Anaplasmataceae bacterium]